MARGRGGYRRPASPAPVSGPGALSQRTDGGPGQPIRVAPGGDYGDRTELVAQQKAAPLAATGRGAGSGSSLLPPGGSPGLGGVFGPTERPTEPITAGVDMGPGPGAPPTPAALLPPEDPNMLLRAIVATVGPHPDLLRMLNR